MNKERALNWLILADITLAFSVMGIELFFHWTLPASLRDYVAPGHWSTSSAWDLGRSLLWCGSIATTLVAWVALLNRWWFARRLYTVGWLAWLTSVALSGPAVLTPLGAVFDTMESLVGGVILGLVYFSELSRRFERPAELPAAARITA